MSSDLARVHYFDRQYLRLQDFVDEQSYHLAAHRRHNLGHHRWGIVAGLRLLADEGLPFAEPGHAVDGYGRDLVLEVPRPVPLTAFDELASEVIAVWLVYDRSSSDPAAAGWASCGGEGGGESYYRERERPRIVADVPDPDTFDPRNPATVPEGDRPFPPHRPPPDAVSDDWPVYLGRVTRDAKDPAKPKYTIDLVGRPYAGAVAASVAAPFDRERPRLLLGGDLDSGAAAFEVRVPGTKGAADPELAPALEIDAGGALRAHGDVSVRGDLAVEGGVLELARAVPEGFGSAPADEEPQPWRLYRHPQPRAGEGEVVGEQLRIEMAEGGGEVVIGMFSAEEGRFVPCLTVDSECTVTVHGDLVVEGGIEGTIESQLPPIVPGLSPQAANMVLATFQSGIAGSNLAFVSPVSFRQPAPGGVILERAVAAAEAAPAEAMAAALAADADLRGELAEALRAADPPAADDLAALLADDGEG